MGHLLAPKIEMTSVLLLIAMAVIGCSGETAGFPTSTGGVSATTVTPVTVPAESTGAVNRPTEAPSPVSTSPAPSRGAPTAAPTTTATAPTSENDPLLLAAGDIAVCGTSGAQETARLLENNPGTVITLGDNA